MESGKDVVLVVDGRDVSGDQDLQNSFYHDGVNPGAHIVLNNAFIDGLACEKGKSLNGKCVTDLARDCKDNIEKAAKKLGRFFCEDGVAFWSVVEYVTDRSVGEMLLKKNGI